MRVPGLGQEREERGKIVGVKGGPRRKLPQDRPELRAELADAAVEKALDRGSGLGQNFSVRRRARRLHGKDEVVRRVGGPAAEALRALRPVESRVDLDRGELAARIGQLRRLLEP